MGFLESTAAVSSRHASRAPDGTVLAILDPRMRGHAPAGCPESPARYDVLARALESVPRVVYASDSLLAPREDLLLAHAEAYVDRVLGYAGSIGSLDHETHLSPGSVEAARVAAGAALDASRAVREGRFRSAFALVRPPGHHAGRDAAMGYCIFNNAALAALAARRAGVPRVLVLDVDVHHGNGTEEILSAEPGVLFVSIHQDALFPELSGGFSVPPSLENGGVVNVPLLPLATDADYELVAERLLRPLARAFRPDLVIVSAGFDAHWRDEQGGMRMSSRGLVALMLTLRSIAESAGAKICYILEGGYDLDALEECVRGTLEGLAGAPIDWPTREPARAPVQALVARARAALALDA